jgi:hypothetical protein
MVDISHVFPFSQRLTPFTKGPLEHMNCCRLPQDSTVCHALWRCTSKISKKSSPRSRLGPKKPGEGLSNRMRRTSKPEITRSVLRVNRKLLAMFMTQHPASTNVPPRAMRCGAVPPLTGLPEEYEAAVQGGSREIDTSQVIDDASC